MNDDIANLLRIAGRGADQGNHPASRLQSATHGLVAATGLIAFLIAVAFVRFRVPFGSNVVHSAMFIIAVTTAAIFLVDLGWRKVHRRPSTGLDFAHDDPSWPRTITKFAGLLGSLGFVGLCYWLFPEYHDKSFASYRELLPLIVPPWIALAIPYFFWIDRRMREPRDGYWHMGKLVTLQWDEVDLGAVGRQLLAWVIKGYFLALMFTYLCRDLDTLFRFDFGTLTSFQAYFRFLYYFLIFIDVGLASLGYLMSFRLTDTHIRSSEPTMLGWIVTLACYEPLWSIVGSHYLVFDTGYPWDAWLGNKPVLYVIWGSGILVLIAVFTWSTVMFGARFSNLTHRGIITNGPYRWTKHPAYLVKNLSFWMLAVPFMPRGTWDETLSRCLLLLGLNFIYFMRAKTEEWHLSRDPEYVQYALWMEEHGMFRFLKHLPVLRYIAYRRPEKRVAAP
jgi:protein-S-isoprenylcysteine O-methyltransferase Ste14